MKSQNRAKKIESQNANQKAKTIMICLTATFLITACIFDAAAQTQKNFTRYVNPFIGTGGHGHTFPGATVPFGAVQLSPDTRIDNWDGSSGYHYSDNIIYGFSHTHLSGTGIPDYCDILFAPYISDKDFLDANPTETLNGYASKFSHTNEKAEAGYYSVKLDDENIMAEMTATTRAGFQRYTFPETTDNAKLTLDLKWRDKVLDSEIQIINDHTIAGFRRSSSWAKNQVVYFYAEFSKPFTNAKIAVDEKFTDGKTARGINLKSVIRFSAKSGEKILVKVGVSAVDTEGARKNLQTEISDWNFDKVRADAKAAWNKELSKIEVTDENENNLTIFYTALYHANIQPNVFQDVDGRYLGADKKIHTAEKGFTNYTVFSLWDTFRAAHPLYTIIDQKRTADFINTFLRQYEQGGRLPVWKLAANETDTMIGYHAVSVIADAMAKNIKGFDYDKAFEAAKHSAELNHFGLEAYKRRGYISSEDENESVSKTLEYAYDDYCIAEMAANISLGLAASALTGDAKAVERIKSLSAENREYVRRARSWENLFDRETGFIRPRRNGGFFQPFAPQEVTLNFTEGNSWVYSFFAPHDVMQLIQMHGGREKFAAKLDELFTTSAKLSGREQPDITGLIGQYAHGNEPSHHIAYLYDYAGEPWKTQKYVRQIMDEFYKNDPDGLIGNEDCGQMSAWFILSASGFYPVAPGNARYEIGTPLFKEVKYNLENGKSFVVKAANVSARNIYVKSVKLNGQKLADPTLWNYQIAPGGVLEFEMTAAPDETAFQYPSIVSIGTYDVTENIVAVPLIEAAGKVFESQTEITLKSIAPDSKILYSIDGGEPQTEYAKPFLINKTALVKAVAVNQNGAKSLVAEASFLKKPNDWMVKIASKYNRQYTGGGDQGLIDGIRGTTNFASGEWQGYQAQDFVATIDLQRETEIHKLGAGFLQNARSWIWMPTRIEFEVSDDNINFRKVAEIKTDVAPEDMKEQIRDYSAEIAPVKARFIRVHAYNLGKIPAWHPGAGDDAFIFVDEIFVE